MPGRLFLTRDVEDIAAAAGVANTLPPHPPRFNIAPGQDIVVLTATGLGLMRWGLIPQGRVNARGRPVLETIVNARSETLFAKSAFAGLGRAAVPADGWYEWTGPAGRKTPHRIEDRAGRLLWFAAVCDVWNGPGGVAVPQVATLTCGPSGDVAHIHDRMGVLLSSEDLGQWLGGSEQDVRPLLVPWPEGRLKVGPAEDVDWTAP